jgi:hypothetical protein
MSNESVSGSGSTDGAVEKTFAVRLAERNPRLLGLLQVGGGLALLALNVVLAETVSRYGPVVFALAFALFGLGGWIIVTGRTHVDVANPPPLWWKIGFYTLAAIGGAVGLLVAWQWA